MRIADPRPDVCSVCRNSHDADTRFFDLEAMWDANPPVDDTGAMIMPGDGRPMAHEYIFICELCVKNLLELVDFKPQLHSRQLLEIKRLSIERDHWRATADRMRREADKQLEANGLLERRPRPKVAR